LLMKCSTLGYLRCMCWMLRDRPPWWSTRPTPKYMGLRKDDLLERKLIDVGPSKQNRFYEFSPKSPMPESILKLVSLSMIN